MEKLTALEQNEHINEQLSALYDEVQGSDFYLDLFPDNENSDEMVQDYSKPSAVYLYYDDEWVRENSKRRLRRRKMTADTWEEDYLSFIHGNGHALCGGITYRGNKNRLQHAQGMNALILDLDNVRPNNLRIFLARLTDEYSLKLIPRPTYVVASGTGLHVYYVFDEPIELFPYVKEQLKGLKYELTDLIWEYRETSSNKTRQYQSINQSFRMVGSTNDKYGTPVRAYKTGSKVSLAWLNTFIKTNKVDLDNKFRPSKATLDEAKMKWPDWYEKVVIRGEKMTGKWSISPDLYEWWLRKSPEAVAGHRYKFMFCLAVYAHKCDIPYKKLEKDMFKAFEIIKEIPHDNPLTEKDIYSALEGYHMNLHNMKIEDFEKLSAIRFERNKRNYRPQELHLKLARGQLAILREVSEVKEGRPVGSGTKEQLVRDYITENPGLTVTEIAMELGISRTTVYKYREEKDNE